MGEKPLYVAIAHWTSHLGGYLGLLFTLFLSIVAWVFSPFFSFVIAAVSLLGFAMLELVRRSDRLALYHDGIAREYKLFSTKRTFAEYDSVQDLEVTQSILERMVGVGTLHINTAGSHGQEIIFRGIDRPHELEAVVREKMRGNSVDTVVA